MTLITIILLIGLIPAIFLSVANVTGGLLGQIVLKGSSILYLLLTLIYFLKQFNLI